MKARWVLSSWHSSVNLRIPAPSDEGSFLVLGTKVAVSEFEIVEKIGSFFKKETVRKVFTELNAHGLGFLPTKVTLTRTLVMKIKSSVELVLRLTDSQPRM